MKFLDLAGVQQFKDYNDSKYVVTEDVVDLTAGSLDFYTKDEIDEMLEDFNPELTETDPVFTASAASGITSTDISNWNSKQDAISDLATIRSNAADGAAKVSNVQADWNATSGLAQILHKPTIPAEVTESTVSGWGFTKNTGTLTTETDPVFSASAAAGITASDITNWNSKTDNVGTITGITMNGASKGTSGVIDLGTVITSHQDISGKADKSAAIGSLSLSLDSTNYKITLSGTKVDGTTFTVSNVIDLPLESVVVNGSYNNTTKKVVLTLQNGNTVDFSVADLVSGLQSEITSTNKLSADLIADGTTNKVVTATEKSTWNGKQDVISDLATIRSNAEAGAAKVSNVQSDWNATSGLAQILNKPTIPAAVTESTVSGWGFTKNTGTVTQVKVGNKAYNPSSGIVSLPAYPARAVELYKFIVNDIDDLSDFTSVSSSTYSSIKTAINASKIVVLMFSTQDPYSSYFILDTDTSLDDCIYFHRVNGNGRTVQVIGIWPNGNVDYSSFENYVKPSGGIPKTDLASAVQTSLGKADTALQSFTETDPVYSASAAAGITSSDITNWNSKTSNVGTITGITMNGSSKGTSGVVNLGTVVTSETDPVFTASAAAGITSSDITNWNNKVSNVQSDWNATTGAAVILNKPTIPAAPGTLKTNNTTAQTASASESLSGTINLHKIAKTGNFSDLLGTETVMMHDNSHILRAGNGDGITGIIGDTDSLLYALGDNNADGTEDYVLATTNQLPTESTVSGWGFTKNAGTITGITMNGSSKGTSGVVDLGTVITSHATHKLNATNGTASAVNQGTEITYVESVSGTTTATSGDLSVSTTRKKVTIPTAVTESTVSGWGFTKNSGTVTGVKMNGTTKTPTSGTVDLGTVITSETSLSKGTTTGSGNAVTDISVSGHQITLTKGSTFLTSETQLSKGTTSGSGNVVTDLSVSGHTVTLTKGSNVPVATSANAGKIPMITSSGGWEYVTPSAIYSGSATPNNNTGNNGDIYLQTS